MIKELRNKNNRELCETILMKKSELLEYRFLQASGEFEKTHKIKIVKKIIAMSFTILKERNVDFYISSNNGFLVEYKDGKKNITVIKYDFKADKNNSEEKSEKKLLKDNAPKVANNENNKPVISSNSSNNKNLNSTVKTQAKKATTKVVKTTGNRGA